MELFNTLKDAFAPAKFIEQAEKNTQAVLAYVEPKELSKTLVALTGDFSTFARAQVEAVESIALIFQKQVEEVTSKFVKTSK